MAVSAFPREPVHTYRPSLKKLVIIREKHLDSFIEFSSKASCEYFLVIIKEQRTLRSAVKLCLHSNNCVVLAFLSERSLKLPREYAAFAFTFLSALNYNFSIYCYNFNEKDLSFLIFSTKLQTHSPLFEVYLSTILKWKVIFFIKLFEIKRHILKIRNKVT